MIEITSGPQLTRHWEGCELVAYLDSLGNPTWGIGDKQPGIKVGDVCAMDYATMRFDTINYPKASAGARRDCIAAGIDWDNLDEVRQAVLTDMAFEMGAAGLADFHDMLAAIKAQDWVRAEAEALDSRWAKQVSTRAHEDALILRTGEWPQPGDKI